MNPSSLFLNEQFAQLNEVTVAPQRNPNVFVFPQIFDFSKTYEIVFEVQSNRNAKLYFFPYVSTYFSCIITFPSFGYFECNLVT